MDIKVMDHQSAFYYIYNHAGYTKNKDFAVISIQEYPSELMGMEYKAGGHCRAALNLWFSDIDDKKHEREKDYIKMITTEDAEKIKDFVHHIKTMNIDTLIIHCMLVYLVAQLLQQQYQKQ